MRRWLLVQRDLDEPDEQTFYLAYALAGTSVEELARTAGKRWRIEDGFEEAKGETGSDEYEVSEREA
jgi:SRSO17 transposase